MIEEEEEEERDYVSSLEEENGATTNNHCNERHTYNGGRTLRDVFTMDADNYHCVRMTLADVETADLNFLTGLLENYVPEWRIAGIRGVWVKIPIRHSAAIEPFYQHGFSYHHTDKSSVTMTWLRPGESTNLPSYANHSLGVAGVVVNSSNSVLVIQERYPVSPTGPRQWKLPGGLADNGEQIGAVAVRETLEETGIQTEFVTLLCFRHQLNQRWGCSDIYAACYLRPVERGGAAVVRHDPHEIHAAQWVPVEEYMNSPATSPLNRYILQCYQAYVHNRGQAVHAYEMPRSLGQVTDLVYAAAGAPRLAALGPTPSLFSRQLLPETSDNHYIEK